MERSSVARAIILLLLLELAVFLVLSIQFFPFTPDDGFIYLYGARSLARGEIPNYTPGEPATNPFGSPLWLLMLTPPYLLSLPPLAWAKVLGLLLLVATALVAAKTVRLLMEELDARIVYAASLTMLAVPFVVACAVNVLDTMLASFALTLSLYFALRVILRGEGRTRAWLSIGLLLVSRPDAFLGAALIAGAILYREGIGRRDWKGLLASTAGLLPGIALFLGTAYAYGELLPDSAAAKAPGAAELFSPGTYASAGASLVRDFSRDPLLYLVYLSLVPFARGLKSRLPSFLFVTLSLVHLGVFLLAGDWMGLHRLYLPSIAVAYTAFLYVLLKALANGGRAAVVLAVLVLVLPSGYGRWKYHVGYNYAYPGAPAETMGRFIAKYKQPGSYLLTSDMGVVPYFADIPTIDTNDAPICNRWRRKHPGDLDYIFNHQIDFIVLINSRADGRATPVFSINERILASSYFRENYLKVGTATWRPSIEDYEERGFSIGYGRYFHLFVSKRIWERMEEKRFIVF